MSSNIIYKRGETVELTIAAAESIAVSTKGRAKVYRILGYPNLPDQKSLLATVTNQQTVFGAYASGATIVVENTGESPVLYQTGTLPVVVENYNDQLQAAPSAETTAATLTADELLNGIITGTHTVGDTAAYTVPTGTLMDTASEFGIDESFDWTLINLSAAAADTITLTAGTAHTLVGTMIVPSAHSTTGLLYGNAARFRTRKTAANTFVTYRIS